MIGSYNYRGYRISLELVGNDYKWMVSDNDGNKVAYKSEEQATRAIDAMRPPVQKD